MSVVDPLVSVQDTPAALAGSRRKQALHFGGGIAVLAALAGLALWYFRGDLRLGASIAGAGLVVLALFAVFPGPALAVRWAWMWLAHQLGRVNTALLLSLMYIVFVIPWGLIIKLRGKSALRHPTGPSYFHARSSDHSRDQFERPY